MTAPAPISGGDVLERLSFQNRGAEIVYRLRRGDGDGDSGGDDWVILIPGACADHRTFESQLPLFPPSVNLLLIDQRGHGDSKMEAGRPVDFLDMLDDLGQLYDRHSIQRADLIAHSYGCFVAQEFAFQHPERVGRLVLIGCYDHHKKSTPNKARDAARVLITYLLLLLPWRLMAEFTALVSSERPASRAMAREWMLRAGRRRFWEIGKSAHRRAHYVAHYPRPHPTLLLRGAKDYPSVLAAIGADMRRRNPLSREAVIPGVGHMCHQDDPETVNGLIAGFLFDESEPTVDRNVSKA